MLVLTSRYGEETALRALRYFASFAFNVSLFLERIPCAKLAKDRKARGVGWLLRRTAHTGLPISLIHSTGRNKNDEGTN